jgi:hypothetical protein
MADIQPFQNGYYQVPDGDVVVPRGMRRRRFAAVAWAGEIAVPTFPVAARYSRHE